MTGTEKDFVYLRVVSEKIYGFREGEINGLSTEQVIKHWFEDCPLTMGHVTRDSHEVRGSVKVIEAKEIPKEQVPSYCTNPKNPYNWRWNIKGLWRRR